jgi:hypothetical protein
MPAGGSERTLYSLIPYGTVEDARARCTGHPIRREAGMALPITPVRLGDVVKLKKSHPCGVNEWEIVRVGADIGLKCRGCERRVMLVRSEFDRRFRGFLARADEHPEPPDDEARTSDSTDD